MAVETEKKYVLSNDQRERMLKNLDEIGAEFTGEDFEENTIYQGNGLAEKGAVLRIRKIGEKAILTFKKRIESSSDVKQQIEFETEVSSGSEIEKIIEHLGYAKVLVYEKRRLKWNFRGVEIVLDELPFGQYMEIEGDLMAISEAEMFLGAEDLQAEYETYSNLTKRFGIENGTIIEARFRKDD